MGAILVALLFGSAYAHNGAVSLYTSASISTCSKTIAYLQTDTIGIYYVKDAGPILGHAVIFRMTLSNENAVITDVDWSSIFNVTMGDIESGISLGSASCVGSTSNVAYLGQVYIFWSDPSLPVPKFTANIVDYPDAVPAPGIYITICAAGNPKQLVLGGTFVFNGSCNPGVEPKSWGAIKELFK